MNRIGRMSPLFIFLLSTACSLSSSDRDPLLQIDLSSLKRAQQMDLRTNFLLPPVSVSGFSCYGVNVTGPGISDTSPNPSPNPFLRFDAAVNSGASCIYRGVVTPPLSTATGEVIMEVPPGPLRLVQVVGVDDPAICQSGSLGGVGTTVGGSGSNGKFFEIARGVMQDVFNDRSVALTVNWPSSAGQGAERAARRMDCVETPPEPAVVSAAAVSSGGYHTCILQGGAVYCSGNNTSGQLGIGSTSGTNSFTAVSGLGTVTAISSGGDYTCAITSAGALYCWGGNASGQLGDGTTSNRTTPVQIFASNVTAVSTGLSHTCAIVSSVLKCWGANSYAQVGTGAVSAAEVSPVDVSSATGATHISVGATHTCAVAGGYVKCWGSNANGKIGNGLTTGNQLTPYSVAISSSQPVSVGVTHSCAIFSGALKCWGGDGFGQIGNGATTGDVLTYFIAIAANVTGVSLGADHSCAIASATNTAIQCWGKNTNGQVGNATTIHAASPVEVVSLGATAISAGGSHTCAIVTGLLRCWGDNSFGQFGNGTFTSSLTP